MFNNLLNKTQQLAHASYIVKVTKCVLYFQSPSNFWTLGLLLRSFDVNHQRYLKASPTVINAGDGGQFNLMKVKIIVIIVKAL